jgi:LysM repeat protein
MARYPSISYGRQRGRTRRWVYTISALLIVAVVIAFIYGYHPFGKGKDEAAKEKTSKALTVTNVESEALPPETVPPKPVMPPIPEPNLSVTAPGSASEPNSKAAGLITEAVALLNAKPPRIIDARDRLNEVLSLPLSEQQRAFVKKRLSELADEWLFSRKIFPQDKLCGAYKVEAGELLSSVGSQFKVPYEILMEINKVSRPEALQAGETIKVINGPFHAIIYRSAFTMDLYLQNTFVRSFPVGLGQPGKETPTGLWRVKPDGKLISPTWTDPDTGKTYEAENPDYPLGSRWIGLEGTEGEAKGRTGFAIHGTKNPKEIGAAGSRGCIRLHNGDAILVYNLLMPGFSQVKVVE